MIKNKFIKILLIILILLKLNICNAKDNKIIIAVSSNFLITIKKIKSKFEHEHKKCNLLISSDSTANIYTKIINEAPFHLFISADKKHPLLLEKKNMILYKPVTYAIGKIVLWIPNSTNKIKKKIIRTNYKNLSISNPKLSPYGEKTAIILKNLKIKSKSDFIYGCNISQTFNFILSKNSEIGFIALSQVINHNIKKKDFWKIPQYLYPIIEQTLVLLDNSKNNKCANDFFNYMKSEEVKNIIHISGYKI